MTEALLNLLIQIPLVGIFVWFILEWSKRMDKAQAERDAQWREFLKEAHDDRDQSLASLSLEIKIIAKEISRLNRMLYQGRPKD